MCTNQAIHGVGRRRRIRNEKFEKEGDGSKKLEGEYIRKLVVRRKKGWWEREWIDVLEAGITTSLEDQPFFLPSFLQVVLLLLSFFSFVFPFLLHPFLLLAPRFFYRWTDLLFLTLPPPWCQSHVSSCMCHLHSFKNQLLRERVNKTTFFSFLEVRFLSYFLSVSVFHPSWRNQESNSTGNGRVKKGTK